MTASVERVTLLIPFFLGLALVATPAQAQIGFAGGYGLNFPNDPGFSGTAQNSFESTGGFNAGLFYDFRLGRVTLRPGVFLRQSRFDWNLDNVALSPVHSDIRFAEFPIDVLLRFPVAQISPYVLIGPSFNFVHTDQPDLRQTLAGTSSGGSTSFTSLTLGAGIEIAPAGLGVILVPEIRYSHALSGFLQDDYIVRTVAFDSDSAQRMSSLTFRLGITLPSFDY